MEAPASRALSPANALLVVGQYHHGLVARGVMVAEGERPGQGLLKR